MGVGVVVLVPLSSAVFLFLDHPCLEVYRAGGEPERLLPTPGERGCGGCLLEWGEVEDAAEEVVGERGQPVHATAGHRLRRSAAQLRRCDAIRSDRDLDWIHAWWMCTLVSLAPQRIVRIEVNTDRA